jgi:hypothetical protein
MAKQQAPDSQTTWATPARTGWSATQSSSLKACEDCGEELQRCAGCSDPRCLRCEPYRSDDCRWLL